MTRALLLLLAAASAGVLAAHPLWVVVLGVWLLVGVATAAVFGPVLRRRAGWAELSRRCEVMWP